MVKSAVIFFHKNIQKIYKQHWITKCVKSVLAQSYRDFDIFEMNYGGEEYSVLEREIFIGHEHKFYSIDYPTHIEAMLFLLNKCFIEEGYDLVFNTNLDDYYSRDRFKWQVKCCIEDGYAMCSGLWDEFVEDENGVEKIVRPLDFNLLFIEGSLYSTKESVLKQFMIKHNVINHSGVCFSRKFWIDGRDKFGNKLRYRDDKPYEDMTLWMRALSGEVRICVINHKLIMYRKHENQITTSDKSGRKPDFREIRYGILLLVDQENIGGLESYLGQVRIKYGIKGIPVFINNFTDQEINLEGIDGYIIKERLPLNKDFDKEFYLNKHRVKVEMLCDKVLM